MPNILTEDKRKGVGTGYCTRWSKVSWDEYNYFKHRFDSREHAPRHLIVPLLYPKFRRELRKYRVQRAQLATIEKKIEGYLE